MRAKTTLAFLAILYATACGGEIRESQPIGWRTDGTGRYPDADPPTTWAPDRNVVWATPLSSWSNATPVIVGNRVFNCAEPTTLLCLRRSDGQPLWQKTNTYDDALGPGHGLEMPNAHDNNGYSSCTPVSNGRHVYAVFGNGVVACYDLDGNRRWIKMHATPANDWGHSASPLLVDDKLIVMLKDLSAIDPESGETLWSRPMKQSFGSPVSARVGSLDVIITPSGYLVNAIDGRELADFGIHLDFNAPIVEGDMVYFITKDRGAAARISATADGGVTTKRLWNTRLPGDRYYASPVFHDGMIYAITRGQRLAVIDATNGRIVRDQKMDISSQGGANSIYSSVTLAGDHLYLFGLDGTALILAPGPAGKIIARNSLEGTRSCPVFSETRMFLRGMSKLYCIAHERR